ENRVRTEVELSDEWLMTLGGNDVMNVLAHSRGVMPRHDGVKRIPAHVVGLERGTISIASEIIKAEMVRLPDFNLSAGKIVSPRIKNATADTQRHPGIIWHSHVGILGGKAFIEWTDLVPLCRVTRRPPLLSREGGNRFRQTQPASQSQRT